MKQVFKLLRFVKPYWKKSLLSLALLVVVVLMDLAIPRLVQRIIDQGITPQDMKVVTNTFLLMLGISILDTLFAIGNNNYSVQVGESVARDLREALFLKIQSFSFGNLDRLKTGQLMVRLSSDSSVIQRVVQISLRIGTRAPLIMIGSIILMFNTDQHLALTMLPLLLVTSAIIVFFAVKMGPLFLTIQQKLDKLNTVLQENIAGVRVVKAFVRAHHEAGRFEAANEDFTDRNIKVMQFMSTMGPALSVCVNIGIVIVLWAGGLQSIHGNVTTGQLVAFINYLQTALGPLMIMVNLANVWAAGMASAERVNEVLEEVPEVQDAPGASTLPASTRPRVVFENVGFHYNGSTDTTVLEGINLTVEPGQTVAILGATGAGKSTLINLIPRFYDASEGRILIDGVDIRQVRQDSLLAQVGIVPQETVLFSGTVRDNIRYGRPEASDEEVVAASKAAQAHEFILDMEAGYDTHVEERGVNLSGGQKQRIAIARALLTRPSILILDDSTSSVDVETETKIQAALDELMQGRTCFVVAQRISTVLKADKIIVIEKGRIAAEGTHRQLLKSSPIYQEIYASQLGNGVNGV
ncbi:MAG: ABC transporter ATP-binding protein [Chloroflexi bacterium]|nr:ABC transporter ATP-binding protein [Chloroflexota bacterium]MBE3118215.1 ABC transporter ATP-binding protein [Candidatus Atribacteria bacterium]